jgi:hypothetical protein
LEKWSGRCVKSINYIDLLTCYRLRLIKETAFC